jgi:hypothetical protein
MADDIQTHQISATLSSRVAEIRRRVSELLTEELDLETTTDFFDSGFSDWMK